MKTLFATLLAIFALTMTTSLQAADGLYRHVVLFKFKDATTKDEAKKLHNCLVPWESLPDGPNGVKKYDRDAVRKFPDILAAAGLEVRRKPGKT